MHLHKQNSEYHLVDDFNNVIGYSDGENPILSFDEIEKLTNYEMENYESRKVLHFKCSKGKISITKISNERL